MVNRRQKSKGRGQKGFTLIELIVVVTIIGILAGVAIANVKFAQQKAREAALRHNLFEMRKAIDDYYADKQKYPANLQELETAHYLRKIPKDPQSDRLKLSGSIVTRGGGAEIPHQRPRRAPSFIDFAC